MKKIVVYKDLNTGEKKRKLFSCKGTHKSRQLTIREEPYEEIAKFIKLPDVEFLMSYYISD